MIGLGLGLTLRKHRNWCEQLQELSQYLSCFVHWMQAQKISISQNHVFPFSWLFYNLKAATQQMLVEIHSQL